MASVRASAFTARRDALAAHAMLADVAPARRATSAEPSESLSEDTISPRDALLSTRTRDLRPSAESRTYSAIPLWDTPLRMPVDVHQPETPYEQRSVAQRRKMVEDRGGDRETERAVAAALNWLARHQHADGRWDSVEFDEECGACGGQGAVDVNIATTGLALLSFLATDNTHVDPGQYREVVRKGLDFLLSRQADDGGLIGGETMYSHGIATIALAEAYGMTGDEALAWPVKQAADFIYRARNTHVGGWRYEPREDGDTSVLGWQVMALKSAERAGIEVSPESYAMARRWLEKVSRPRHRGLYAYQPGKRPTPAMTAEGMFTQQLLGHRPTESRMRESAEFVSANLPDWDKGPNTYYWYYGTLAMFQHGGHQWRRWNTALVDSLLEHQRDDGEADGSWDPDGQWASIGGRVYQTAICALTLEVYYRYLPQFMIDGVQEEVGTIRGVVTDAWTGEPLDGATIRLDLPDQPPATTTSDSEGNYVLFAPRVPDFFALSAARDGYVPGAANVSAENLDDGSVTVDFTLQPERSDVVAIEASPDVHHLGNDRFEGSVNSQFQKESEGDRFLAEFELTAEQLAPNYAEAEIRMLTKGVQCPHEIRINGTEIDATLDRSPRDGSFGEYTGSFDANLLHPGTNTIEFRAISCTGDLDDFEFINIRIGLGH
ncbi:MAG: carboxypeptidase regulatory-like domain-containing protein [Planctomycetes bacterium]|nr:carboxypeptidase regulatory-like domain-containing protein [Planctomycetota bacterium]